MSSVSKKKCSTYNIKGHGCGTHCILFCYCQNSVCVKQNKIKNVGEVVDGTKYPNLHMRHDNKPKKINGHDIRQLIIKIASLISEKLRFQKPNSLLQYLADIEDHLNITIQQVEPDLKVPSNEFDGKVVYGQKRTQIGSGYQVKIHPNHFKITSDLEVKAMVAQWFDL